MHESHPQRRGGIFSIILILAIIVVGAYFVFVRAQALRTTTTPLVTEESVERQTDLNIAEIETGLADVEEILGELDLEEDFDL